MSNTKTGIEWTDATWNPVTGCSKVSAGCQHCYAETVSHRWGWTSKPWTAPFAAENVVLHPDRLDDPIRWTKPRRIFVNSMSDLFHEQVPQSFIDKVFGVMAASPKHVFQILTKRPERMREYLNDPETKYRIWWAGRPIAEAVKYKSMYDIVPVAVPGGGPTGCYPAIWPLPNVWVGTSVEDQQVNNRITELCQTPAVVRFLSCEPLIGPLSLQAFLWQKTFLAEDPRGVTTGELDWVIVGGESGPNHRPIDPDWVRSLRDECVSAGVPFFFKQWGGKSAKANGRDLDGRTWEQMPETAS